MCYLVLGASQYSFPFPTVILAISYSLLFHEGGRAAICNKKSVEGRL